MVQKKLIAPKEEELASLAAGKMLTVLIGGKVHHFFILQEPLTLTITGFRGLVKETSQAPSKQITILPGGVVVV